MVITYKKGNVLDSDHEVIMHGCNCSGGFGSGIAGEIARRYPKVREGYLKTFESGKWKLGDIQCFFVDKKIANNYPQIIVNCATQQNYGNVFEGPYVSYRAIREVMRKVLTQFGTGMVIAMPKIGAGLGGGNWEIIEAIINEESGDREVFVYTLE